jgi:hypothetical protein
VISLQTPPPTPPPPQDEAGSSLPPLLDLRSELKDLKLSLDLAQDLALRARLMEDLAHLDPHGCPGTPTQVFFF